MADTARTQRDDGILDRAAGLFAQRGFEHTSVQAVADAVGLSKAGLLHHYPSKDALLAAVLGAVHVQAVEALGMVADLPGGPERDRRSIEALVDLALTRPGTVAFMLNAGFGAPDQGPVTSAPVRPRPGCTAYQVLLDQAAVGLESAAPDASTGSGAVEAAHPSVETAAQPVFAMFGVEPTTDDDRFIRVLGAVVSLAYLSLISQRVGRGPAWRNTVIATSYAALGHPARTAHSDQVEA